MLLICWPVFERTESIEHFAYGSFLVRNNIKKNYSHQRCTSSSAGVLLGIQLQRNENSLLQTK